MMNSKLAALLGLILAVPHIVYAQKYEFSSNAEIRQSLVDGKHLEQNSSGVALLDAVDKGFFDIALIEINKPGVAKKDGPAALNIAIRRGDHKMIEILLAGGVSPNAPASGWYPVGEASLKGDVSSICYMMNYGVDVSKRNDRIGNVQMALSKMHFDAAVLLMLSGYKIDDDESAQIKHLSQKKGVVGIADFIEGIHSDRHLAIEMCRAAGPAGDGSN